MIFKEEEMANLNPRAKIGLAVLAASLLSVISGGASAQEKLVELEFSHPAASESNASRTLASLVKVRDIGEQYATGGLYLMTHFGDREDLFRKENQERIDHPLIEQLWRACSIFSVKAGDSVIMGRNWDNQNVGSIIVSLYQPPKGYASVSFTRAIDMGFPLNMDIREIASGPFGTRLLLAPFYAFDGLNEHGLAVAVAGVGQVALKARPGRQKVFDPYLMRLILDRAKTVDEAVAFVEDYVPFDLDGNSLNAHFYVVDASGRSAILEYDGQAWRVIPGEESWQVLTNKPVFGAPEATLRQKCWRFKSISETLERTAGKVDSRASLKILRDVAQKGTTWSVVYSPTALDLLFSVYQTWDVIYHLPAFGSR
jgi:hypothetical protein